MPAPTSNALQKGFVLLFLALLSFAFLGLIQQFLVALALAAIFTGLFYPVYRTMLGFFKGYTTLASTFTLLLFIFVVGVPLLILISMVTSEAIQISQMARQSFKEGLSDNLSLSQNVLNWLPLSESIKPYEDWLIQKMSQSVGAIGSWLATNFSTISKGTLGFVLNLFIMLYAMFFFFIQGPNLLHATSTLLPLSTTDRELILTRGMQTTKALLKSIIVIGLIQGALVALAFWVLELNGPAFWGTVVFFLSAIPGLGAVLVWAPAALLLLLNGDTFAGIALLIWGGLIISMVDNILRPYMVSQDTKLPDVIILVSILGGIATLGPVGILLGPILAAVLDTALEIYRKTFANQLFKHN